MNKKECFSYQVAASFSLSSRQYVAGLARRHVQADYVYAGVVTTIV